jgi:DNA-binding transcriptional MerR regulator
LGQEHPIYTIGAVERMVGLPTATIRNWEERYALVKPERSAGGHRLYSRAQVEQLRFLKTQAESGLQPAEAHRLLRERLAAGKDFFPSDEAGQGPRLLILLAERDRYAADLTDFFLRTEGYEVVLTLEAAEAEQKFQELRPELAVVELMISGGTGAQLCRRLKDQGVPSCLAVSPLESREEALSAGADAFLQKPLEPLQFVSTVKDLLGRSAFLGRAGRERA